MSTTARRTRSRARRRATAWPMPLAAPVTTATRPSSPLSCMGSGVVGGAIDVDGHAGHVAGLVAAQGDHELRDLAERREAPQGDAGGQALRAAPLADRGHEPGGPPAQDDA